MYMCVYVFSKLASRSLENTFYFQEDADYVGVNMQSRARYPCLKTFRVGKASAFARVALPIWLDRNPRARTRPRAHRGNLIETRALKLPQKSSSLPLMPPFLSQARYRPESDRPRFPHFTRTHTDSLVINDRVICTRGKKDHGISCRIPRIPRGIDPLSLSLYRKQ